MFWADRVNLSKPKVVQCPYCNKKLFLSIDKGTGNVELTFDPEEGLCQHLVNKFTWIDQDTIEIYFTDSQKVTTAAKVYDLLKKRNRVKFLCLIIWPSAAQLRYFKGKRFLKIDIPLERLQLLHRKLLTIGYKTSVEDVYDPTEIVAIAP